MTLMRRDPQRVDTDLARVARSASVLAVTYWNWRCEDDSARICTSFDEGDSVRRSEACS